MIELVIEALKKENEKLKMELAVMTESLGLHIKCYSDADDRLCSLKKENEALKKDLEIARAERNRAILDTRKELAPVVDGFKKEAEEMRWGVVLWGQRYERVLGELVGVKKERDAIKKENEAMKKENAKLDSAWKATAILLGRRSFHDKFPTQMNEGESAKRTDDGSAARGGGEMSNDTERLLWLFTRFAAFAVGVFAGLVIVWTCVG